MVTFNTWERHPIFKEFRLARLVIRGLKDCSKEARTWCFVVMPDHVHWLVEPNDPAFELSSVVQKAKSRSTRAIHEHRQGLQVWQAGFHDHRLRPSEDVRATARYIIRNPLRAGLVRRIGMYPHWDARWI